MWIFAPEGLLMPARIPEGGAEGTVDPKWLGPNGEFTIQVRGRAKSHLSNVIRDYFEPLGLPYSDIQMTPEMDYNCRFYTTHEAMATVAYKMVMDVDFLKFKPQAERTDKDGKPLYKDGKEYHGVLNSIWGTVCRLGLPGGIWGTYSSTNPNGYKPKSGKTLVPLNQQGTSGRTYGEALGGSDMYSLTQEDQPTDWRADLAAELADDDTWWSNAVEDDDGSYTPTNQAYIESIIDSLDGIPEDQWQDNLPPHEFALIEPFLSQNQSGASDVRVTSSTQFQSRKDIKKARRSKSRKGSAGRRFYKKG